MTFGLSPDAAKVVWGLVLLGLVVLAWWAMRRGWRSRARSQQDLAEPPVLPARLGEPAEQVDGLYLGTVTVGDWLDRVVVHGLGARSSATLGRYRKGVLLVRDGEAALWIPSAAIQEAEPVRALAGRAYPRAEVLAVTWEHDGRLLTTGFHPAGGSTDMVLRLAADIRDDSEVYR